LWGDAGMQAYMDTGMTAGKDADRHANMHASTDAVDSGPYLDPTKEGSKTYLDPS
jgi:hypothetical protein